MARVSISLSPDTLRLIEEKMRETGVDDAEGLIRLAFLTLDQCGDAAPHELDDESWAAIAEADKAIDDGQGRPWEEVRAELRARFIDGKEG